MHSQLLSLLVVCVSVSGCYCCPEYYGPGMGGCYGWTPSYNSCVSESCPPAMGNHHYSKHPRRMSIAERRQQRDLKRWYRDLNSAPHSASHCSHCSQPIDFGTDCGCGGGWDEFSSYDGSYVDGFSSYGGEYPVDGGIYHGGVSDSYCPDCENQFSGSTYHHSGEMYPAEVYGAPSEAAPTPVPSSPPTQPTGSGNPQTSMVPRHTSNEYYYPPQSGTHLPPMPSPQAIETSRPIQPASVDPSLFAPPVVE
ncbi:hypothetical protein AB1L42_07570 [Thalassoglobus sp. JC818]|uniref:hypothetical protein n=1 Tax=Thalassoglobus sp. JC818 TaxID=3232136 RepID=UPI0034597083